MNNKGCRKSVCIILDEDRVRCKVEMCFRSEDELRESSSQFAQYLARGKKKLETRNDSR